MFKIPGGATLLILIATSAVAASPQLVMPDGRYSTVPLEKDAVYEQYRQETPQTREGMRELTDRNSRWLDDE